ncbi:class E sortase [Streptomyces sp. CFMR 7]|uniref:class E sortase n=1 Tax=Streptomyces sp. CFMR 7 TaxID=1649184 RepID=UPI0006AD531C|nr:class E sortase [Streptomyces sp. CFMR 7]ALC29729.1 membrane protein [Streptomyces sp. CFMR 7]
MRRRLLVRALWGFAEVAVSLGVVLLLLVAHQLWWTNRLARDDAGRTVQALEREWGVPVSPSVPGPGAGAGPGAGVAPGAASGPGAVAVPGSSSSAAPSDQPPFPRWDQAYAVLRIPRIGLTAPVAEGTGKGGVLDRGYVGHYTRTAQAGQAGNFALAGHRNTHGEPFRRIDRLRRGDRITVETRDAVYTYTVDKSLARTAPSDSGVIAPVPRSGITTSAGYGEPGYYLTLTTCTPEFSSRYRLVVWGKLTAMRPR